MRTLGQSASSRAGQGGRGVDDVLAVVEDEHRVPVREGGAQPVDRVARRVGAAPGDRALAQAERVEHRVRAPRPGR